MNDLIQRRWKLLQGGQRYQTIVNRTHHRYMHIVKQIQMIQDTFFFRMFHQIYTTIDNILKRLGDWIVVVAFPILGITTNRVNMNLVFKGTNKHPFVFCRLVMGRQDVLGCIVTFHIVVINIRTYPPEIHDFISSGSRKKCSFSFGYFIRHCS